MSSSEGEKKNEAAAEFRQAIEDEEAAAAKWRAKFIENAYRRDYDQKISNITDMMDSFKKGEVNLEKAQKDISVLITKLAVMIINTKNKKFAKLDDRLAFIQKMRTFKEENEQLWSGEKKIIARSIGKVLKAFSEHGINGTGGKRKTRKRRKRGGKKTRRRKSMRRKSRRRKSGRWKSRKSMRRKSRR